MTKFNDEIDNEDISAEESGDLRNEEIKDTLNQTDESFIDSSDMSNLNTQEVNNDKVKRNSNFDLQKKATSTTKSSSSESNESSSKLTEIGNSVKEKLSDSKSKDDVVGDSVGKIKKTMRVIAAIQNAMIVLWSILLNPITWIILLITLILVVLIGVTQTLGPSDFANNCNSSGDVTVSANMPADEVERGNIVATWLTSNNFEFLGNKPMSKAQAAGIVGNLHQEGEILPTTIQNRDADYYKSCNNECVLGFGSSGGIGVGLIQWDSGRRSELVKHAQKMGKQWYDINAQLDFFREEANGSEKSSFMAHFANCKDAAQCAIDFCNDVERAGTPMMENRTSFAKSFESQFKGGASTPGVSGSVNSCSSDNSNMDASGVVQLAISIAYPKAQYDKSKVSGDSNGESVAPKAYKEAKALAEKNGGKDGYGTLYASCDRFVATVYKATKADVDFPWGPTSAQYSYLNSSSKWKEAKCGDRKPGDVIITKGDGHIMLYLGKIDGEDQIASASYQERVGGISNFISCSGDSWNADGFTGIVAYRLSGK